MRISMWTSSDTPPTGGSRHRRWLLLAACAVALTAGCGSDGGSEGKTDGGATADGSDGNTSEGMGKVCAGNADCQSYGLTCFPVSTGYAVCSSTCQTNADCKGGTVCSPVQGALVCTPPIYCDACTSHEDCGPTAPYCRQDPQSDGSLGPGYCTMECVVGDGTCPAGSSCSKIVGTPSIKDFYCQPDNETCTGDGSQCSPCKIDADCSDNHTCLQPSASAERFCAQHCDSTSCPAGYQCTKVGGKSYCYATVEGKATPTCSAGKKGFCDACSADWQCASGKCASKNNESYCAQPGSCTKETEKTDCPPGTFCVPTSAGQACAPPPAFKCQQWKACLASLCGVNEICVDGLCKDAP